MNIDNEFKDAGIFRSMKLVVVSGCRSLAKLFMHAETGVDALGQFAEFANDEAKAFNDEARLKRARRLRELEAGDRDPGREPDLKAA